MASNGDATHDAAQEEDVQAFCDLLQTMKDSMLATRDLVKSLREKQSTTSELDTREGISLLSLKHHQMLSYLQSLSLVAAHRAIGNSLADRTPPPEPFSAKQVSARGVGAGDRVDAMVQSRIVLEKIKVLEGRMKYQIDKLVRIAEEGPNSGKNIVDDPLAFRPNPQALMDQGSGSEDEDEGSANGDPAAPGGIYRPPKLAPMPYTEPRKSKSKDKRAPVPSALAHLAHLDPSRPFAESTSGLGATPALSSQRARELKRITEFEEENMTRLVMKKRDARRRALDEADIALGGTGASSGRRGRAPGTGLEDEFADILKSVGRAKRGPVGDGYEDLRQRGRKEGVLERSRARSRDGPEEVEDGPRQRKRTRFDMDVKANKRRQSRAGSKKR